MRPVSVWWLGVLVVVAGSTALAVPAPSLRVFQPGDLIVAAHVNENFAILDTRITDVDDRVADMDVLLTDVDARARALNVSAGVLVSRTDALEDRAAALEASADHGRFVHSFALSEVVPPAGGGTYPPGAGWIVLDHPLLNDRPDAHVVVDVESSRLPAWSAVAQTKYAGGTTGDDAQFILKVVGPSQVFVYPPAAAYDPDTDVSHTDDPDAGRWRVAVYLQTKILDYDTCTSWSQDTGDGSNCESYAQASMFADADPVFHLVVTVD